MTTDVTNTFIHDYEVHVKERTALKIAPKPLVIIIKRPCAEDLVLDVVSDSTKSDPDILKKSKAIP